MDVGMQQRPDDSRASDPSRSVVWDRPVRLFHWSLVGLVAVTAATGFLEAGSLLDLHVVAGTAIGALVAFRVIWGFTGTTYARFASFVAKPRDLLRHIAAIRRRGEPAHGGHNPIGGWMILALLSTLTLLVATGAVVLGGVLKDGPLAAIASYATGRTAKELHELLAFGLVGLVALHVFGVVAESLRTKENLVAAMVRGFKTARADSVPAPTAKARPVLATALTTIIGLSAAGVIAHLSSLPVAGVPPRVLEPTYAKECGSCHSPHHPSAAPVATWAAVMAGLSSHFGDNASLDDATARQIAAYLSANSAEKWDTKAAHLLSTAAADNPLRITATAGWKRLHREVPDAAFQRRSVGGRLNCSQCHSDAEAGRFDPRAIAIPKEKTAP